jgi:hypothetical protein
MPRPRLVGRRAPGWNPKARLEQPINRSAEGSVFGRREQWREGEGRQTEDSPQIKLSVVQEAVGGMFFHKNKVIFTGILVPVVVRRGFFHRGRQTSVGVRIEDVQGGCAQANGE